MALGRDCPGEYSSKHIFLPQTAGASVTVFYENLYLTFRSHMNKVKEKTFTVEVPVVQPALKYSCSKFVLVLLLQCTLSLTYSRGKLINRD